MYNPQDYYNKLAKKVGYEARSAFKLDQIDQKFRIFDNKVANVLDIGCAPGSWLQYTQNTLEKLRGKKPYKIIGFDLKPVAINLPHTYTYQQDITDHDGVANIIAQHEVTKFDVIISDMAPNTIGAKDIDAMRSILLLEQTLWMYEELLKDTGSFVIKIFMGPGFEEFLARLKKRFGGKNIKSYKPLAVRKESKEIYIVKRGGEKR